MHVPLNALAGRSGRSSATRLTGVLLAASLGLSACTPQSRSEVLPERYVDPPRIAESLDDSETEEAEEAWDQITGWALDNATEEDLLDPDRPSREEALTTPVTERMTPETAEAWQEFVDADLAGDREARDTVNLLRFHEWPAKFHARRMEPVHHRSWITAGTVRPVDGEAYELRFTLVTRAGLTWEKSLVERDINRRLKLRVVPDGDRWVVEDFDGELRIAPSPENRQPVL